MKRNSIQNNVSKSQASANQSFTEDKSSSDGNSQNSLKAPPFNLAGAVNQNHQSAIPGNVKGDESGERAFVKAELGIRLHAQASPNDESYTNKSGISATIYAPGTEVKIIKNYTYNGTWSQVRIGGNTGWIEKHYLAPIPVHGKFDSITKEFYYVKSGDVMENVIRAKYPNYKYETGNDRRAINESIIKLNKEGNPNSGIYFDDSHLGIAEKTKTGAKGAVDPTMHQSRVSYQTVKLSEGKVIRLPSSAYIDVLRANGQVGTRPEWMNSAIEVGRTVEGFITGIAQGFLDAGVGTVTGLWDLVKSIFSGKIFTDLWGFAERLMKEGLGFVWDMISGFYTKTKDSFIAAWNNPNPHDKAKFFGKIVGNIIFEIVLAVLTAGIGTAIRYSPKVAKILSKFPKLVGVATKLKSKLKSKKGSGVPESFTKKKGKEIAESLGYGDPPKGYHWTRTPDGDVSLRNNKGNEGPAKVVKLDKDGKPIINKDGNVEVENIRSRLLVAKSKDLGDLELSKLSKGDKKILDDLIDERKTAATARNKHSKGTDEYKQELQKMIQSSYKLGENAAEIYMKKKGGKRLFPPEGEKVGSTSRSGEFDQVWEVDGEIHIIEAKGGGSPRGSKKVGNQQVQQGTREYMDDMIINMRAKNKRLSQKMEAAARNGKIKYIEVRQKISTSGDLGNIGVKEYKLN